ncbi:hypothetical protein M422DRAFT_33115 [Sphaerobolus stellatus SS14]|uniref:Unplaced genomic scaffold SPHSTscaffold_83, whole genome shotgun sequence n=1 Tax=Sphaerobolus stellatus (strain SS14) TaxID=990650 RepID=A0A0C9VLH3_SPHS4|nr:hypothetical protein M422DRAFT_33115 [Sphaerobolus stellatus SS14]
MSKVVFVGNVPYNMNEETLIEIFKKVGNVVGFRLVFDRETGKPRGYGFCEFEDHETAQSAVRNLNNVDCGGRPLRIDLADSDPFLEGKTTVRGELVDAPNKRHRGGDSERDRGDNRYGARGSYAGGGGGGGGGGDWLSNLPRGKPLVPGITSMDAISQSVADIRPGQMMDILSSMKGFILDQPDRARTLLTAHPQLAYALFQALLVHQIVDPAILHRMIAATTNSTSSAPPPPPVHQAPPIHAHHPVPVAAAPPPLPPHLMPPPHSQSPYAPPPNQGQGMYGNPPPPPMGYPPPPSAQGGYYTQPSQHVNTAPPPPAPSAPPAADPASSIPHDQRAMLVQMLALTPEQINALPPEQRQAIQQLRSQFMALGSNM